MLWSNRFRRLKFRLQYFPFTRNTLVALIVCGIAANMLRPETPDADDPRIPFIKLMARFAAWGFGAVAALSVLSALAAWGYFLLLRRSGKSALNVSFEEPAKNSRGKIAVIASVPCVFRPLLGFVKVRLFYDNRQLTDKYALTSALLKKNSVLRTAVSGRHGLILPDIAEYTLEGGFVYFEDFLQLISLPAKENLLQRFYRAPELSGEAETEATPRNAHEADVRIEEMRRVQGDYFNYKNFEAGDDVRRIVWKMYARNRSLSVRIPERFEPFASHVELRVSFHAGLRQTGLNPQFAAEMLNRYKQSVWTVYSEIEKKQERVKFKTDQSFDGTSTAEDPEVIARMIANAQWQQDLSADDFFESGKGALLVVGSLTSAAELERILAAADGKPNIIFIPLSKTFKQFAPLRWISYLLFLPKPDRLSKLKNKWLFSSFRRQVLQNEQKIARLLDL